MPGHAPPPARPSPPPSIADLQRSLGERYELQRLLGSGGMGHVYLAWEGALQRHVALKILPPESAGDPGARARFVHEARTAAALSHPNIVAIYSTEDTPQLVYFAMAFVSGETLAQRVWRHGGLDAETVVRILRETAGALGHAHRQGVVHRDVKPDNILLEAGTGRVVVTDFGIARSSNGPAITGPRKIMGTAAFMSPEQARGGRATPASDVYALGVVGFYALTGRLPFDGPDDYVVISQHATVTPPSVRTFVPETPRWLCDLIDRCLHKDPAFRFPDGAAVANVLDRDAGSPAAAPLPIRAFLAEGRHLRAPAVLWGALVSGSSGVAIATATAGAPRIAALSAAAASALLVAAAGVLLIRVRRVVRGGHGRSEVVTALRGERTRHHEEVAFAYGQGPGLVERAARVTTFLAVLVGTGGVAAQAWWPRTANLATPLAGTVLLAGAAALVAAIVARARYELREDPVGARRLRFWQSWLGRLMFRIAGGSRPPAVLHATPSGG